MIKKINLLCWLISSLPILYFFYLYPQMPEEVPVHFNAAGEPDRYGNPLSLLIAVVAVVLPLNLIMQFAPVLDPKHKLSETQPAYRKLRVLLALCMASLGIMIVHSSIYGLSPNMIALLIWLLFAVLGNYMQNLKHNYFIGVRTPWTLENEEVWRKTHRLMGKLFFYGGVTGMLLSLILQPIASFAVLIAFALLSTVISFIYSFKQHKNLN